jgi:hypothetical protein
MKSSLKSRIERLEARVPAKPPGTFRSGFVTCLPEDYVGERHMVVVTREPVEGSPGHELCEFEERPGPAPPGTEEGGFVVCWEREKETDPSPERLSASGPPDHSGRRDLREE